MLQHQGQGLSAGGMTCARCDFDQAKRLRGWGLQVERLGVTTPFPHIFRDFGLTTHVFGGMEGRDPWSQGRRPEREPCAERGR